MRGQTRFEHYCPTEGDVAILDGDEDRVAREHCPDSIPDLPAPPQKVRNVGPDNLAWIVHEDGIHESPSYGVLHCCRALHLAKTDEVVVLSKDEGGRWALDHLPENRRPIVIQALACYRSGADVGAPERRTHAHAWDHRQLDGFGAWVADRLASTCWFPGDQMTIPRVGSELCRRPGRPCRSGDQRYAEPGWLPFGCVGIDIVYEMHSTSEDNEAGVASGDGEGM